MQALPSLQVEATVRWGVEKVDPSKYAAAETTKRKQTKHQSGQEFLGITDIEGGAYYIHAFPESQRYPEGEEQACLHLVPSLSCSSIFNDLSANANPLEGREMCGCESWSYCPAVRIKLLRS